MKPHTSLSKMDNGYQQLKHTCDVILLLKVCIIFRECTLFCSNLQTPETVKWFLPEQWDKCYKLKKKSEIYEYFNRMT